MAFPRTADFCLKHKYVQALKAMHLKTNPESSTGLNKTISHKSKYFFKSTYLLYGTLLASCLRVRETAPWWITFHSLLSNVFTKPLLQLDVYIF